MDIDAIITHLGNFQNTWKGWDKLISGVSGFFAQNPIQKLTDFFTPETSPLNNLSSNK